MSHHPPVSASASSLFLLCSLLLLLHSVYADRKYDIVVGEITPRDVDRPTYEVRFPPLGSTQSSDIRFHEKLPTGVSTMRMVTARGQPMRCMLPSPPKASPTSTVSEHNRFDDIDKLLSEYENMCFVRPDGWWTFEFCYQRHVIQKHIIPRDRDPYPDEDEKLYVLGKLDKELDIERRKNASLVSTRDAPFTQLYVDGTHCDLTNEPRRVLIKYLCTDDALHLKDLRSRPNSHGILKSVREVESCVYEIEFMSTAICQHEAYKEKMERSTKIIHCSMEDENSEFEGLMSTNYKKASLNL